MPKRKNPHPYRALVDTSKKTKPAENASTGIFPRLLPEADFFAELPSDIIKIIFSYLNGFQSFAMRSVNKKFDGITFETLENKYFPYLSRIQPEEYKKNPRQLIMGQFKRFLTLNKNNSPKAALLDCLAGEILKVDALEKLKDALYPIMAANGHYEKLKSQQITFSEHLALKYAAEIDQTEMVNALLTNVETISKKGMGQALVQAAAFGNMQSLVLILSKVGKEIEEEYIAKAIVSAGLDDQFACLDMLLKWVGENFKQPIQLYLYPAIKVGKDQFLTHLLEFEWLVSSADDSNKKIEGYKLSAEDLTSHIETAIYYNQPNCLAILAEFAKDNITIAQKESVLIISVLTNLKGHPKCLRILLSQLGSLSVKFKGDLLLEAVKYQRESCTKILLEISGNEITLDSKLAALKYADSKGMFEIHGLIKEHLENKFVPKPKEKQIRLRNT